MKPRVNSIGPWIVKRYFKPGASSPRPNVQSIESKSVSDKR